jgi:hypothetical protein
MMGIGFRLKREHWVITNVYMDAVKVRCSCFGLYLS